MAEVEREERERRLHHDQLFHQLSEVRPQYDTGEEELSRVETGAQFNWGTNCDKTLAKVQIVFSHRFPQRADS